MFLELRFVGGVGFVASCCGVSDRFARPLEFGVCCFALAGECVDLFLRLSATDFDWGDGTGEVVVLLAEVGDQWLVGFELFLEIR